MLRFRDRAPQSWILDPFYKADFQTSDGPRSMADFQKVVPLVVKKHLLYDGKFLGTFWPLVWDFFENLDFRTILTKIGAVLRINMITTNGLGLFVFLTKTLSKCSGVT